MLGPRDWMAFIRKRVGGRRDETARRDEIRAETLLKAHGHFLALLGALLERENVIGAEAFARSLSEFAAITASEHPEEGRILSLWASYLTDLSVSKQDPPSLQ